MTEVEQQAPQNGIDLSAAEEDDNNKSRPADIEQDMREMERRKRVEAIMSSKLFREELERIVDSARESGTSGILQQLSDIVGVPANRVGSIFKTSNCMVPINDIRGVESMGYAKGEKILRCKLAATFRLLDLYGWTQGLGALISARLKVDQEYFLVNPYGLMYHEITASSLNKVDMQGNIIEQGTTNFGVNKSHFVLHSVVHAARPDIRCAIYVGCTPVVAVSSLKTGLLPLTKDACVLGEISTHHYTGTLDNDERDTLVRNLGPNSKIMLLTNHGALCCGETIEEAFHAACHIVQACETQLKLLPVGLDNLVLIPEESRKQIYEQSRRPPEDLEKKFAATVSTSTQKEQDSTEKADETATTLKTTIAANAPKWRVGGAEFEALMRMLDNAGYRTGYIYRHPLIKSDPPKPKNDVELPPAVSSLGYLLEEEELFRQGIWKRGELRKGGDRSRWLNSPNVYQKVEVLETGTPDPKKITKWVAEGSPTHSTPVRIEDALQFVPANTNPKEFKRLQQQIKDNRRADKISAGPQSHILEGVTWDEANRIKDATVSQTGDHVVLMGAASKGIIQRGFQHNATVYKAPYAKNPFDNVTDDELNEYKRTVERKKKSIHGEYTDTDFSESEALSSQVTSGAQQTKQTTTSTTAAAVSQSEPEDVSEHQVMRIQTQQAPVPSQPEVVLSDAISNELKLSSFKEISHSPNNKFHMQDDNLYCHKNIILRKNLNNLLLARKYRFLYEQPIENKFKNNFIVQTIHKIEIFPNYTYPFTNNSVNVSQNAKEHLDSTLASSSLAPYRTVSHYGFNYPLTYMPTIPFYPSNLLSSVEQQRQKVIDYIKTTAMNYAQRHYVPGEGKNMINTLSNRNTHFIEDDSKTMASNESFISFKEIQLTPKPGKGSKAFNKQKNKIFRSKIDTSTPVQNVAPVNEIKAANFSKSLNSARQQQSEIENDIDTFSEHFSSSLSISGIYPPTTTTTTLSHTLSCDHENSDSGDNLSSSFPTTRAGGAGHPENLYRSYVLRNCLPLYDLPHYNSVSSLDNVQNEKLNQKHNLHKEKEKDEIVSHYEKPEAEQAIASANDHLTGDSAIEIDHNPLNQKQKQVKLTLNTTKRRNSASRRRIRISSSSHDETASCSSALTNLSTNSIKSLEIHVNITIKNSDCAKTLHAHEQDFKSKLENVIDNEIQLIADQLAFAQNIVNYENKQDKKQHYPCQDLCLPPEHSFSAPELAQNEKQKTKNQTLQMTSEVNSLALKKQPMLPVENTVGSNNANYQSALNLLEHELENLLNNIIRSNELHNRAIMCSCKTKISHITENVKSVLNSARK